MINIKSYQLQDVPVLEVVEATDEKQPLPLVVFYHGW